jgi:hypothetical protein
MTSMGTSGSGPVDDDVRFSGTLIVPEGLERVAELAKGMSWPLYVWISGFDGTPLLRSGTDAVALDMDLGQGPEYYFEGTVEGSADDGRRLLGELSAALVRGGVVHYIAIACGDEHRPAGYLHHRWPEDAARPEAD